MAPSKIDDHIDEKADAEIVACLTLEKPRSFFLFAGAGSGKTRSLVDALREIQKTKGRDLRLNGQKIGVITYTNAACDEIKTRLQFDPLIEVSTIHSFVWSMIGQFHVDMKKWLLAYLQEEIMKLEDQQRKGRASKASLDREKSLKVKRERLANLDQIKRFTYNPNGENRGKDSLNHSEVIKIGANFLLEKPLMQELLINKYPILLIDESQDTNGLLMDAFLRIQSLYADRFTLGLFGDTMQRIYADGKIDLGIKLPAGWATPAKKMNHRCPIRIIKLINKIRSAVDGQEQKARSDKDEGYVRIFILPSETPDKDKVVAEKRIAARMMEVTGDPLWSGPAANIKTLTLEHHMAARRLGFLEMFEVLYKVDSFRTSLLDGSLSGLRLFSQLVLPLVQAKRVDDNFSIAAIVRKYSPLLTKDVLSQAGTDQALQVKKARDAVESLIALWSESTVPSFLEVLQSLTQSGLFEIPESLRPIALRDEREQRSVEGTEQGEEDEESTASLEAWDKFLKTSFDQIEPYSAYVEGRAPFDTHQGVKGLEFERVMVIIDDNEARGFSFSYDKLFGVLGMTETDIKNEREGKDTGINRTRRLFYVTCSRVQKSLAIVAYSTDPGKVRNHVLSEGWFEANEIEAV